MKERETRVFKDLLDHKWAGERKKENGRSLSQSVLPFTNKTVDSGHSISFLYFTIFHSFIFKLHETFLFSGGTTHMVLFAVNHGYSRQLYDSQTCKKHELYKVAKEKRERRREWWIKIRQWIGMPNWDKKKWSKKKDKQENQAKMHTRWSSRVLLVVKHTSKAEEEQQ